MCEQSLSTALFHFSPFLRTWRDGPSYAPWTWQPSAVQLQETVLLVGGTNDNNSILNLIMMYSIEHESFVQLASTLSLARTSAVGVAVPDSFCQ